MYKLYEDEDEEHLEQPPAEQDGSVEPMLLLLVDAISAGQRLDQFVAATLPRATRAEAQRLIELPQESADGVWVNSRRAKANYRLKLGDAITAGRPASRPMEAQPEDIPLTIVFEDEDLLVIDKPRGMVVHPAPGSETGTLVNAVLHHCSIVSRIGGDNRPGIVHRLDKDTGGLLMVAKNDPAHRALQAQIEARTAERRYTALVWGVPGFKEATIDAPIGRHPTDRKKMAVVTDPRRTARSAQTNLTVRESFGSTFALLEAKLQTGRTHQIRVHGAYIQYPIVGDPLYGGLRKLPGHLNSAKRASIEQAIEALGGQALHAYSLSFAHPRTSERLSFLSPLPEPMEKLLKLLRTNHQSGEP